MKIGYWNLKDLYSTNDVFLRDFEKAKKLLDEVVLFKGQLKLANPETILDYFKKDTEFSKVLEKLAVYSFCKQDDNGLDKENVKNYSMVCDLFAKTNETLAFAKTELAQISDNLLIEMSNNEKFKDFDRTLQEIIRQKAHTLSEKEEQNIALVSSFSSTDDTFSMLSNVEMDHGSFVDENGKTIKLEPGNYNTYINSKSQKIRKTVAETYIGSYKKMLQTFANLLLSHIKYENFLAKNYGFVDCLEMKCYSEEVSSEVMKTCITNISKNVHLVQKYFKLKKKILGLDEFYSSDIAFEIQKNKKKIKYEDAVSSIAESFSVLGEDYKKMFLQAVSEGWIDAYPRTGKKSGGYTISSYGEHPYILLNFDGTFEWASALAHEFGHAMHSFYSAENQPFAKYDYTLFVAEIVSLTNEIIYIKYLLSKAKDKQTKIELLSHFLQLFNLNVFNSSMFAEFELFMHNGLMEGKTIVAEDLCSKLKELAKKYYGTSIKLTKNYECGWARNAHLYRDYYLYKYAMGFCAACFVSQRILSDANGEYLVKYKKFLSLGGALDPISELKVAEIDVESDEIYDGAFKMFNEFLTELNKLMEDK